MPMVLQLAWFKHYFPNDYYRTTYPTSDGVIPYKLFWLFYRASRSAMALERINLAQAVLHGIGMALEGNSPAVRKLARREMKEAYGQD